MRRSCAQSSPEEDAVIDARTVRVGFLSPAPMGDHCVADFDGITWTTAIPIDFRHGSRRRRPPLDDEHATMTDETEQERELRRRMDGHELYVDSGPGLEASAARRLRARELAFDFNATRPSDAAGRARILGELLGARGDGVWIEPPLSIAYGDNVSLGDGVYINSGATFVDDVGISIGARVMLAPNVVITTTGHPVHPDLRRDGTQFSAPVVIEDDVWIGSNATILPGITIGSGSVIAAGSVVTKNIPSDVVAAGVPARVVRRITDEDREFGYRPPVDAA